VRRSRLCLELGPYHKRLMTNTDDLFRSLFDDAAIFPPGNKPLDQAVSDHVRLSEGKLAPFVGPFVISYTQLAGLAKTAMGETVIPLPLSVTVSHPRMLGELLDTLAAVDLLGQLRSLEIVIPDSVEIDSTLGHISRTMDNGLPRHLDVYLEVPRNDRRRTVLAAVGHSDFRAKFRTGGTVPSLYPSEEELADSILSAVRMGIPFKATAGLHHAIRNRDPFTGFEQHGFLNVIMAIDACLGGATVQQVAAVLGDRDDAFLAKRALTLPVEQVRSVRNYFRSFGTCSIVEPVADLMSLGLLGSAGTG